MSDFVFDEIEESKLKDRFYTVFENGLGLVKKNGKYGYIDKGIKTIVPFGKYNECKPFENNKIAIVKNNKKYKLINKQGEELSVAYDEIYKDDNFYLTKIKNKLGVLDSLGNQVFPNQDKEISIVSFNFKNEIKNFFLIKSIQDKYGIVNEKREDVIPIKYDSLSIVATGDINIIIAREKNRFGILDIENQIVLPFDYTKIEYFGNKQDYFYVHQGDYMSLTDKDLKFLFPFVYSEIQPDVFNEQNRFIVQQNGKFGIIDRSNNIILPIEYDYISNWVEYGPKNIHNIQKNQKYGLVDTDGKIIMPITYDKVLILNDECVFVSNNGKYGVTDAYNNKILDVIYDEIYYFENHNLDTYYQIPDSFYVKINGKYDLIDNKGNILKSNATRSEIDSNWMKISN